MLKITKLTKIYGPGRPALYEFDLAIDEPGLTAIIGPSGAGKSTLLRCINRLVEPTSGSIELDGVEITKLKGAALRDVRRRIGMIFQSFNLIDRLTVMENVLSGRLGYVSFWQALTRRFPQEDIDRAYYLLERVGLAHYVNKRADALSGGERQRVGVARALMQDPKIILADEPTASLDPKTSIQIMGFLKELSEEFSIPVLVNLHNVELARRYSRRVVGLQGGRKVFDGNPGALTEDVLDAIYGTADRDPEGVLTLESSTAAPSGVAG
ncbi:MAG: phosphonate ABC transporter ATP-binding protein [Firmicutes bacterium ZCTH02-B6]|nr:MAG: phosphonate ABC transporter ATP-binding protein [Firmicutes bacterium ZCTH02-B6]